jgi:hypothetical protein
VSGPRRSRRLRWAELSAACHGHRVRLVRAGVLRACCYVGSCTRTGTLLFVPVPSPSCPKWLMPQQ